MNPSRVCFCAAALLLAGCVPANYERLATDAASLREVVCIDNVEYLAIPVKSNGDSWAITPHYRPDGTLYTCADSAPKVR
jgi:hypothetical protein